MGVTDRIRIEHGNIAGGLIRDMNFVSLIREADQRAAHGDDVIIRVGRKYQNAFGKGGIARPIDVARPFAIDRFSTGPSGDGFRQASEYLDVDVVSRAMRGQKVLQSPFVVIFFGELEDGFPRPAREPDRGFIDRLAIPGNRPNNHGD